MKNDEAKFILSAYRPDGDDAGDARFAEALAQAEQDPELRVWFREERRFDSVFGDALGAIPVPPDLRTKILAGGEISRPKVWFARRGAVLALAAGLVLLAAVVGIWFNRAPGLDYWQRDALALIPRLGSANVHFDLENKNPAVLQQWLQGQNAPTPAALPLALRSLPSLGCKKLYSHGSEVSILCFEMRTGQLVHLIVTEQQTLSRPPPNEPRFVHENGWTTASWSAHGRSLMLATKASEAELREILNATAQARLQRGPVI